MAASEIPMIVEKKNGEIACLHYAKRTDNCVRGQIGGARGTTIEIPYSNILRTIQTTEDHLNLVKEVQDELEYLLRIEEIGTRNWSSFENRSPAFQHLPTPTSSDQEVNSWYKHLSLLSGGDRCWFGTGKNQRKRFLSVVSTPAVDKPDPIISIELEGSQGGEYLLKIDAAEGTALRFRKGASGWTDEREITALGFLTGNVSGGSIQFPSGRD